MVFVSHVDLVKGVRVAFLHRVDLGFVDEYYCPCLVYFLLQLIYFGHDTHLVW